MKASAKTPMQAALSAVFPRDGLPRLLTRVGVGLGALVGFVTLSGVARDFVLDGQTGTGRLLAADAVHALLFGSGLAVFWTLGMLPSLQRPFRSFLVFWCTIIPWGFVAEAHLPYSSRTNFWMKAAAYAVFVGILLFRIVSSDRAEARGSGRERKRLGESKEPKTL